MKAFSELTGREKKIELLRWITVLPAAALGGFVASIIADVTTWLATPDGMIKVLIIEFPKGVAIVMAGAKTAPRCRVPTAMVLTALWIFLSLIIHVLLRETLGWSNYMAVIVAAVAAAGAAAYICSQEWKGQVYKVLPTMSTQTIFSCIRAGDIEAIRSLLDGDSGLVHARHADPGSDYWTTLQLAAAEGQLAICKLPVERGAEVYTNPMNTYPPVILAAWSRHQDVVDYFLHEIPEKAAGTNQLGVTINLAAR